MQVIEPNTSVSSSEADASLQLKASSGRLAKQLRALQTQPLLTPRDVASRLNVSQAWVKEHATRRNPRIPTVRLGNKKALLRFRLEDVERFIQDHLVGTGE